MKKAKDLLNKYNLTPKKRFGQNFLIDDNILKKIAKNYNPEYPVLEIGPGTGALTQYLLLNNNNVYLLEYDQDMINIIKNEYKGIKEIHSGDASKFDLSQIFKKENKEFTVFGNLPYNVSSAIIFNIIKNIHFVKNCYFMLQKEVSERLTEKKGNKNYSRLTVMTDLYFEKKILFHVKPNSFLPPPRVDSSIIELRKREDLLKNLKSEKIFAEVVKQAFSQRRKMLRNNLKQYLKYDIDKIIDLKQRAENISVQEYIKLSNIIFENKF